MKHEELSLDGLMETLRQHKATLIPQVSGKKPVPGEDDLSAELVVAVDRVIKWEGKKYNLGEVVPITPNHPRRGFMLAEGFVMPKDKFGTSRLEGHKAKFYRDTILPTEAAVGRLVTDLTRANNLQVVAEAQLQAAKQRVGDITAELERAKVALAETLSLADIAIQAPVTPG
jgi:hypothetical protein